MLTEAAYAPTVRAAVDQVPQAPGVLVTVDGGDGFTSLAELPAGDAGQAVSGGVLLYTSGTSGRPKGVVNPLLTVGAPIERVAATTAALGGGLGIPTSGRALLVGPWYHSAQLFFAQFPLLRGCALVMRRRFDPVEVLRLIDDEKITISHLVPTQFIRLLRVDEATRAAFSGASLARIWHGGGPCPPETKRAMIDWWGPVFVEYYAATEAGIVTLADSHTWLARPGTVGRPAPPTEVLVVDDEGHPVPAGREGRVAVRRPPGARFPLPQRPGADRTGARRPAHLHPRRSRPARRRRLPVPHRTFGGTDRLRWGQRVPGRGGGGAADPPGGLRRGGRRGAGRRVRRAGAGAGAARPGVAGRRRRGDPRRHCRAGLAGFKVPRSYELVDRIPREPTGKVPRAALRDRHRHAPAPPGLLADPRTYLTGVPHDEFARRRREAPVAWVDEVALTRTDQDGETTSRGRGFWAVTRYAAVSAVSRDPALFSSAAGGAFLADARTPADLDRNRQLLINMDAPEHTWVRRLVAGAFTPRAVGRLREMVTRHAEEVVSRAVAAGDIDVVADLAAELPLLVLTDLLGMPATDRKLLFEWSNNLVGFDDPEHGGGSVPRYRDTFAAAFAYVRQLAAQRRARPTEDLMSLLVHAESDGRGLTDAPAVPAVAAAGHRRQRDHPAPDRRRRAGPAGAPRAARPPDRRGGPDRAGGGGAAPLGHPDHAVPADRHPRHRARRRPDRRRRQGGRLLQLGQPGPGGVRRPGPAGPRPRSQPASGVRHRTALRLGAHLARLEMAAFLTAVRPHLAGLRLTEPVRRMRTNFMNAITAMPARFDTAPRGE